MKRQSFGDEGRHLGVDRQTRCCFLGRFARHFVWISGTLDCVIATLGNLRTRVVRSTYLVVIG